MSGIERLILERLTKLETNEVGIVERLTALENKLSYVKPVPLSDITKRCIVKNCTTTSDSDLGEFVGDLCAPCHQFITTGDGKYSQAYTNGVDAAMNHLRMMFGIK